MYGRIISIVLLTLVAFAILTGVVFFAFNAGVAQGVMQSDKLPAPTTGAVPSPYYYGAPFLFHPFGFGFLGWLMPLFFLFVVFGFLRAIFWHARWGGWRHHRRWENEYPPMFEEWHRKMHENKPADK
jgi:hypothetical protein